MYYEINVAHRGQHLFGTHKRSLPTEEKARRVFNILRRKFPDHLGYEVSIIKRTEIDHDVTSSDEMQERTDFADLKVGDQFDFGPLSSSLLSRPVGRKYEAVRYAKRSILTYVGPDRKIYNLRSSKIQVFRVVRLAE